MRRNLGMIVGDEVVEKGLESHVRLLRWHQHGIGDCDVSDAVFLNHS